jgi:hypothetical protein
MQGTVCGDFLRYSAANLFQTLAKSRSIRLFVRLIGRSVIASSPRQSGLIACDPARSSPLLSVFTSLDRKTPSDDVVGSISELPKSQQYWALLFQATMVIILKFSFVNMKYAFT